MSASAAASISCLRRLDEGLALGNPHGLPPVAMHDQCSAIAP